MRYIITTAGIAWLLCGFLAYAGCLANSRLDKSRDALCRSVNDAAVCDQRLAEDRSFFLIWGLAGGPVALIVGAGFTGFYRQGFQFV